MGQISANYLIPGPTVGCGSLVVEFQDISTGNPTSWFWDFGNGLTSTDQNPVMLFNAGVYDVTLIVTDSVVFDTIIYNDIVKVFDNPEANFTADITSGCLPLEVSFEDLSLSSSPIVSWFWDFGDGGNGNIQLPTYEYENQESYTVSLLVKDANGCDDLLVLPNYIKTETRPNLNFSATPQFSCNGSQLVSFTNTTISEHSLSYSWEFGDGGVSSAESPDHFYLNSGVFDVQLVASSMFCVDTLRKEGFTTVDGVLSVDFTSDITEGCESLTEVNFFNQSSIYATDWFWDFGDGTTSVEENPVHIYTNPGEYDVSLKVSYFGECPEMELKSSFIKVHPKPTMQVTVDTTKACHLPFLVQFSDNTTDATNWIWSIDGQEFSSNQNASFEFSDYGVYQTSLWVEDLYGCANEIILEDSIRIEKPIADFSVDFTEGCTPLTVQFSDSSFSSESIILWNWDFGDGNISNLQNPSHLYNSGGLFSVALTIETGIGCVIQKNYTDLIKTTPSPVADFSVDVTSVCGDDPVQFTDLSSSTLPIDSWEWNFGYNPYYNSDEQNPTHIFQDTGLFSITLITEVGGCYDTLKVDDLIQVSSPISSFYVTANCDNYKEFHFFNESIGYDSCYWDFDDGTIFHNPSQHFYYEFASYGEYNVSLHVYNEEYDCWGVKTETMRVEPPMPAVSIDASTPSEGCPPLTVLFHDDSPYSDENPNSPLVVWDMIQFGDGNWSNWNYQNTYEEAGYYTVKHMVSNPYGCKDTLVLDSLIHVYDVVADFNPEIMSCHPFTINFQDLSNGDEPITSWKWKFGNEETSILSNPVHVYEEGTYDVGLIVSTNGGCSDTLIIDNAISFERPEASFSSLNESCLSDTISFVNTSTGENLSFLWDFGNGIQSDLMDVGYAYNQLGVFETRLVITDSIGCVDTVSRNIQVQKPVAGFTTNNITANCPPLIAGFSDASFGAIENWLWNFGDSSFATVENPSHLYEESGVFDVSLVVVDSVGCRDTFFLMDAVNVQGPYGEFSFSTNDVCANEPIDFTPLAFNTNSFVWNFGDGTFATGNSSTHHYDALGVYHPTLLIENASGCQLLIESEDSISVEENTIFVDLIEDVSICRNETVEISLTTNGELVSWWPNDGLSDSTILNPTASPLSTTSYVITLTDGYCQNKDTVTIFVDENLPDPNFQTTHLCYNTPVQFTDESMTIAGATWDWDFGDGTTSQQVNPEHTYNTIGLMPISLTITYDSTQCKSTLLDTVLVNPLPIADAGLDLEVCKGEDVLLSASGGIEYQWINAAVPGFEYVAKAIETTVFSVEVTDINNCKDVDQVTVYVKDLPYVDAGEDVEICEGEEIALLAEGNGIFNWENGLSNQADFLVSPSQTSIFSVSLLGDNECENQDSLLVRVHSLPNISFASNSVVCQGEEISFRAYGDAGTDEIISWEWDFGDGAFENGREVAHIYEDVGGYDVTLKAVSEFNCENDFVLADVVQVNPNPTAEFYSDKREYTTIENEVQFLNYSTDVTESYWDFGDGFYANTMEPSHQYEEEGVYEVTLEVWNDYACSDKLTQEVTIESDYTLWIPNAFTPNGDGLDETFAPKGFGVEAFNMIVYTRWGEEVFFTQDLDAGWNGKLDGVEQAPTGIYTYRIVTEDANGKVRTYQGEINLML